MILVVDASIAAHRLLRLARSDDADRILGNGENRLIAPDLVIAEIASVVWKLWKFEGLDAGLAQEMLATAPSGFDELIPCSALTERALSIAIRLGHSIYDCFYVALAEQRKAKLVSFDERLRRVCKPTRYASLFLPTT
ncbi:type II toxin-antitoxin system VapC family toxin [Rhodoplanes azumiensis]|uniref:Ribonuclease VapC n=1 Tax=Rhodoplanes azumiensis TaxID=1897628 RepID=A0ABW5AFH1_9BRAD